MSIRILTSSCVAAALLATAPATAQIREPGRPLSETATMPAEVPTFALPRPDVEGYMAEDEARGHWPYRFGVPVATQFDLQSSGRWDEADGDGPFVWRLRIASPGAENLGILFDEYDLPAGARVFLYNDDHTHVLGAYTARNNKPNGKLAIDAIIGDALTIEYVQERWVSGTPRLVVGEVVHGYRDIYPNADLAAANGLPTQKSGTCYIDINCPQGDPYQDIKRSVVWGTASGSGCSASILNNTAQDGTPYLFYAEHCGDFTNGIFRFNYERPGCNTGNAPTNQSISGATFLAASGTYDSRFYLLTQTPPEAYEPFYAGWDRTNSQSGPAISISHPDGLPKKIALDNSGPSASGQFWRAQWDEGLVSFGSSGSPLFNGDKRVIGPACCVDNFVCGSQNVFYGRLSSFWSVGNLAQWLDPTGSDVMFMDGLDQCPMPETYCTGKTTSLGFVPAMSFTGSAKQSENDLVLRIFLGPPNRPGVLIFSDAGPAAIPFQGGFLCVNPAPLERGDTFVFDNFGRVSIPIDITPGMIGITRNYQGWGRDTVQNGSMLSDAGEVTFCP